MLDWLLNRPVVIGLAVTGGALSLLASWCQARGWLAEHQLKWLNKAAYAFMAGSIILFITAGLLGVEK